MLQNDSITVGVALAVCVTLILIVICAKVIGSILPLLAKKMKLDPAVMASPFISTVLDAISLLIYFQIAKIILQV